ncbi:MAG: hypothetical protein ABI315_14190 [Bacteroidia bacterium]
MKGLKVLIFTCTLINSSFAQELFIQNDPASNVPQGVLGLREYNESYKEINLYRNLFGLRLMYGLLPKLTITGTVTVSNHHGKNFPENLVSHVHNGNKTVYSTGNFQRGVVYPYQLGGVYLYAKYRFLTKDNQNQHLRMATYGEFSFIKVAHDEAEPNLVDDTKGFGVGLITTYLKKHFAISVTTGVIVPGSYNGFSPDALGGGLIPTEVEYGKAIKYNLSFGYLLLPLRYENYKQTNLNLYVEFMGKAYQQAKVFQYGGITSVPIQTPLLKANNYVEVHPGIQAIFNSNLRIDFSIGVPLINKSYARFYPIYTLGIQRYFYFNKS